MPTDKNALRKVEQEFFDQCSAFYHAVHTPREGERLTHVLITIADNDTDMRTSSSVVAPGIPSPCNSEAAFGLTVGEHTALIVHNHLGNGPLEEIPDRTMRMHALRDSVGGKAFAKALRDSNSDEEFKTAIKALLAQQEPRDLVKSLLSRLSGEATQ